MKTAIIVSLIFILSGAVMANGQYFIWYENGETQVSKERPADWHDDQDYKRIGPASHYIPRPSSSYALAPAKKQRAIRPRYRQTVEREVFSPEGTTCMSKTKRGRRTGI